VYAASTPGFIGQSTLSASFLCGKFSLYDKEQGPTVPTFNPCYGVAGWFSNGGFRNSRIMDRFIDVNYAVPASVFDAYYGDLRFSLFSIKKGLWFDMRAT